MNSYLEHNFLGNDTLKQTLSGVLSVGRLFHAVLLEGESGCGKKTLARIIAAGALCQCNSDKPCGECPSCKKAFSLSHPDILFYGSQSNRSFHIDTVREIRSAAYVAPNESEKKVIILGDVHNMTIQAQNALLKIFEEPPEHVIFILTCDNITKLLPTITSRAVIYRVKNLPVLVCADELVKRFGVTDDEAKMYAKLFDGNLGECIKVFSDEEYRDIIWRCISFVKNTGKNEYAMLSHTSYFGEKQPQIISSLKILKIVFADLFSAVTGGNNPCCADLANETDRFSSLQITEIIDIIDVTRDMLLQNVNSSLAMCYMCAEIQSVMMK